MTSTNEIQTFGELIKALRMSRGLSLYDLEREVEISPAYISRLERGSRRNPTMEIVGRLSSFFDISLSTIEELFPEVFKLNDSTDIDTLNKLIMKSDFIFAGSRVNIDIKLALQEIIESLEEYIVGKEFRSQEATILQKIDKLKERVKSA
ncbi:helix-turn-helix domain-containing protein [Clostridium tagluense]|uniref:helix-turn-helix domain-containing protein n=1 Tax=Clostridium tagluense TaxID=360422 RepID=UPI001CF17C13|nr:helix-turn-helix transcriptional regulator [Clostridium tagluense]MCB2299865.1 helix-turn-helix domain-containing protein [Clostridium tagluense]